MNGQIQASSNNLYGASTRTVQLNYGLTAAVTKYERVCMVYINASVNQAVNAWAILGNLPKPMWPVIVTNPAYNDHFLNLTEDGNLQASANLPNGWYIQVTFSYIMANDESINVELITPADRSFATYSTSSNGLTYYFSKKGDLCELTINGQVTNAVNQWDRMFTIPDEYLPATDQYMRISDNGLIGVYHNNMIQAGVTMSAGMWVTGSVAYIANNS